MFDFLDNDIFVIILNIAFLVFIIYDYKKYQQTKQKILLLNIAITIGFALWVMIPFYNKYLTWEADQIKEVRASCNEKNATLKDCLVDMTIKSYSYSAYCKEDRNSTPFKDFIKNSYEECLDK